MKQDTVKYHRSTPKSCKQCMHYRPTWKYRFCEFTTCVFQKKGLSVFRRKPLAHDDMYYKNRRKHRGT